MKHPNDRARLAALRARVADWRAAGDGDTGPMYAAVREYLLEGRRAEARIILEGMDTPRARAWLATLRGK